MTARRASGRTTVEASDFRHVVLKEGEVVLLATKGPITEGDLHQFNSLIPAAWRDRVLVVDGTEVDVTVVTPPTCKAFLEDKFSRATCTLPIGHGGEHLASDGFEWEG